MRPDDLKLNCFCFRRTLLAVCGYDARSREPYVHVKVHKQGRIIANVVITSGLVRLQCRDCGRWHSIRIQTPKVDFRPEDLPETIQVA